MHVSQWRSFVINAGNEGVISRDEVQRIVNQLDHNIVSDELREAFRRYGVDMPSASAAPTRGDSEQLSIFLQNFDRLLALAGVEGGFIKSDLGSLLLRTDIGA